MKKKTAILAVILTVCFSFSAFAKKVAHYDVIPLPTEIKMGEGKGFSLSDGTKIIYPGGNERMKRNAEFLAEYVKKQTGINLIPKSGRGGKGKDK